MSEIARIVDELERDHAGDPWHGSAVTAILENVTAAQAVARPMPYAHSVWEIVLHMTAWKNEVRRRLMGSVACLPEEGDWPAVGEPSAERWSAALAQLNDAHAALVSAVREMPEWRLLEPTNDARDAQTGAGVSHYVLLHGLVQHDAYHAGQIAMALKSGAR